MLIKKRVIGYQVNGDPIMGFTLPKEVDMMIESFKYFNVEISGTAVIFSSGASITPTKEEIQNYDFSEAKI